MTATEELRRLLDERGVEWRGGLPTETMVEADELDLLYVALPDGRVRAFIRNHITPEQAIAATLDSDEPPYDDLLRCLENDWHISASWDGLRKFWCIELTEDGVRLRDAAPMTATDVMHAIGQLRRDLSGYHDQLMAHNDLQRHCDNQRKRIAELEGLYAKAKAENAKLRELVDYMTPIAWYGASERERDRMRELGAEVPE